MITTFAIGFALIWAIAILGRKPRPCSWCRQPLPRRHIVKHYQAVHLTTDRTQP